MQRVVVITRQLSHKKISLRVKKMENKNKFIQKKYYEFD